MQTYGKRVKFIDHAKALRFIPYKPARRRASDALARVRAMRDAGDEPTNTSGYSPQPSSAPSRMPTGYELVQNLPRGYAYFIDTTATGSVQLWRIPNAYVPDMNGIVGPDAIAGRPPGQVAMAPDANPPGPIVELPRATNWSNEAWASPASIGDIPLVGDRRMTPAQVRAMTPGVRAGLTAAAEVRRTSDKLREMNRKYAAHYGRQP